MLICQLLLHSEIGTRENILNIANEGERLGIESSTFLVKVSGSDKSLKRPCYLA